MEATEKTMHYKDLDKVRSVLARDVYAAYRIRAVEVATAETAHMLPEDFNVFMPELREAWADAAVTAIKCWCEMEALVISGMKSCSE